MKMFVLRLGVANNKSKTSLEYTVKEKKQKLLTMAFLSHKK